MGEDTQRFKETTEELIRTMAVQMGRIEERQEGATEHLKNIDEKLKTQNGRIGRLENWRYWLMGGLGVVGFVLYFIGRAIV